MSRISQKYVENDYAKLKGSAFKAYSKNKYSDCLRFIKAASAVAYHLNFRFIDDEFEELLHEITLNTIGNAVFEPIKGRIVFYDFWGLDNKGLTQQYLSAISNLNVPFLYILLNDDLTRSKNVLAQVKSNKKSEILIIDSKLSDNEKIQRISKAVDQFKPEDAFLHTSPNDVVGVCVFNRLVNVNRYLINLTDHAFWLGKKCCDYFIEFRDYGYTISTEQRNIDINKLRYLPYYPVINNLPFKGFPVSTNGKTILFTGGALYKIYGEDGAFFKILLRIINENENVIIFIAGGGDSKPLLDFIKEFKLESKVIYLGSRDDINEVFAHSDLYLSTYPLTGGLMCQYAVKNDVLPISYSTPDLPFNFIESLVKLPADVILTFTDIEKFHKEINNCIQNIEYRNSKINKIEELTDENHFAEGLKRIIRKEATKVEVNETIKFDKNRFKNLYLTIENNYLQTYFLIKISNLKYIYFRYRFWDALYSTIQVLKKIYIT